MTIQKVANNPLGSYGVFVDRGTDGAEVQNIRIVAPIMNQDTVSASVKYYGWAMPGTLNSALGWRLMKEVTTGNVIEWKYANADVGYNLSWDLRASYTYS